jgi:hypothetical protein
MVLRAAFAGAWLNATGAVTDALLSDHPAHEGIAANLMASHGCPVGRNLLFGR